MSIASDRADVSTGSVAIGAEPRSGAIAVAAAEADDLCTSSVGVEDSVGDDFNDSEGDGDEDVGVRRSMRPDPEYQRDDDLRSTVLPLPPSGGIG